MAIVILCTQAAYVVANRGPTIFGAQAQVQYQGNSWVETQSERVNSRTLLAPVALANGIAIEEFEANWDAGQVAGTQILQFAYANADPDVALAVVDAVTQRYLAQAEALAAVPNPALEAYETLERDLRGEQAVVDAAIADLENQGPSPQLTALYQEKQSLRASIDAVRLAKAQLKVFNQTALVPLLVTEPFVLSDPVGPLPERRAIFGFLGGLVLASAFGFIGLRSAANRRAPAFTQAGTHQADPSTLVDGSNRVWGIALGG